MSDDSDDTHRHCRFGCGLQLKQVPICWRLVLANYDELWRSEVLFDKFNHFH